MSILSERKTERAERMSEVYILLDVILTDENQEEWTPLHLPALFDKLQCVLYTHTNTHRNCFVRMVLADNLLTNIHSLTNLKTL